MTKCSASRSEEHTSELQSHVNLVCRLLLEKKKTAAQPSDMPPGSPFDPAIIALVTYLHACQMVSYARLAEMLEGLFGIKIFFFFIATAPTETYTLSLHDALPI